MISVIMSTFNEREEDVRTAIESILNQSFHEFEFIIILDNPKLASLDNLLKDYQLSDNRIVYIKNDKNIGLAKSLNKAIGLSKYDFLVRMDADDKAFPNRLEVLVDNIEDDIDVYFSKYQIIDEQEKILKESERMPETTSQVKKILKNKNIICHPTVLVKKTSILSSGGYSNLKVSEDYELWIRMLCLGYKFKGINECLLYYRVRGESMTSSDYFKSIYSLSYIYEFHRKWNGLKKVDNFYFEKDYSSVNIDKIKFNKFASRYNVLINNWNTVGLKKYLILSEIILNEPRLSSFILRTFKAKLLRRKN